MPHVARDGKQVTIDGFTPGLGTAIEIRGKNGRRTKVLVLSREQARNVWKASIAGRDRLVYSQADVYFEGDQIQLSSTDPAKLSFGVYPGIGTGASRIPPLDVAGIFKSYAAAVEPVHLEAVVRKTQEAGTAAPVKIGSRGRFGA